MTEVPRRLAPTKETTRDLYAKSGNRCAYPGCNETLVDSEGHLVSEIAHISGALRDSARFDESMTNEGRRHISNLIILCLKHHSIIDETGTDWTVERLTVLKEKHEALYTGALDLLRLQVGDITEGIGWTATKNLGKILNPGGFTEEEQAANINDWLQFAERLAKVPPGSRSVLSVIVNRGQANRYDELSLPFADLKGAVTCTPHELIEHLTVLEHHGLEAPAEDEYGRSLVETWSRDSPDWHFLAEVKKVAAGDTRVVRTIIEDLDFTALDAPEE